MHLFGHYIMQPQPDVGGSSHDHVDYDSDLDYDSDFDEDDLSEIDEELDDEAVGKIMEIEDAKPSYVSTL